MHLEVVIGDVDEKCDSLDKEGNPRVRVEELMRRLHLFDIPDDDGGKKMDACTGQQFFAQEREIAEGAAVVSGLIDDLLDYFRRECGEMCQLQRVLQESEGVHGS